jgi:hypothetical protein
MRRIKNAVFWDATPGEFCKNRRFGGNIAFIVRVNKSEVGNYTQILEGGNYTQIPEGG